jgi:hypothetical protein
MKKLTILVVIIIIFVSSLIACQSASQPDSQPDIPRYTADQVIEVVKAHNIYESFYPNKGQYDVEYIGNGEWTVNYSYLEGGREAYWSFNDATGKLVAK